MENHMDNRIKTPHGLTFGRRYYDEDGQVMIEYKQGKDKDSMTIEQLVECATGCPVDKITFKSPGAMA